MTSWRALPVQTPWLDDSQDLDHLLRQYLPPLYHDDTIIISEKVAVLVSGGAIPMSSIRVRPLARALASAVRPRLGSRGLSVPEKMQYVIQTTGRPRVLGAALGSALTRPFGLHGTFYRIAGDLARDLDGGRPPYEHLLFPPMPAEHATALCESLQTSLGAGVAIVDMNDFGGSIRATSQAALPADTLLKVLGDNPLGQRTAGTPFGVVRRVHQGISAPVRRAGAARDEPATSAETSDARPTRGAVA